MQRRTFLKSVAVLMLAVALPGRAFAAWLDKVFTAKTSQSALDVLAIKAKPEPSNQLMLELPEITDQPGDVLVRIRSEIPGTDLMLLVDEQRDNPVLFLCKPSSAVLADFTTQITVDKTAMLKLYVRTMAGGKEALYMVNKEVKVAFDPVVNKTGAH